VYSHILIPTDGSEFAGKGVERGLALAKAFGAKVTIITATEQLPAYASADGVAWGPDAALADFDNYQDASAKAVLSTAKQKADAAGVAAETVHAPRARAAEAIVETAKSHGCDLIVMASHGRRGVRRLILGSQTAEVLAQSPVPVLVIPPEAPPA
jgi:nucleotide-binding universal stress UspA family protein